MFRSALVRASPSGSVVAQAAGTRGIVLRPLLRHVACGVGLARGGQRGDERRGLLRVAIRDRADDLTECVVFRRAFSEPACPMREQPVDRFAPTER